MLKDLNNTLNSERKFFDIIELDKFKEEDARIIYNYLNKNMELVPFGYYLKRYIFKNSDFDCDFDKVDLKEYQYIITESFSENRAPKSFKETSSKMSVLAKNWLTQYSVSREIVFLLGFGLRMSAEDVSEFLQKALGEHDFNFKSPFETICYFCYKNRLKYHDYLRLCREYEELPINKKPVILGETFGIKTGLRYVSSEDELMVKLAEIKTENAGSLFSVSAKKCFDELYNKVRAIIAKRYNKDEEFAAYKKAAIYLKKLENSERVSIEEKCERAEKIRKSAKIYGIEDISPADVEKAICRGVQPDKNGNLTKFSKSTLAKHFKNKRMSRKHISDVLDGKIDVDRFDLVTMSFFIHAMDGKIDNNTKRYTNFVNETNKILKKSNMGELYIANPYECFLQMCILSDYPMDTYADVFEQSFGEE